MAARWAETQLGKPYSQTIDGGVGPTHYDCSGLVQASYANVGRSLPRVTYGHKDFSYACDRSNGKMWSFLAGRPGALVWTANLGHMGMIAGHGGSRNVIESGTGGVHYSGLDKWHFIGWPMKTGGQVMADNVPALLHKKEVVVNAPIVDKIERMAEGAVSYVDNSTLTINGSGLDEGALRRVLDDWQKEKNNRFATDIKRYKR